MIACEGDELIMKILFVSGNLTDGGAQRVIAVVASGLAERGHDVHLLLYSRNEKEYPISTKVHIEALAENYNEYSKINSVKRILMVRKIVRNINPNVGIGFLEGGYGLYISSLGIRFPKIASARIKPEVILSAKGVRGSIDRYWFNHASAVVLQNNEQLAQASGKWKKCVVIPNPVSEEALSAVPAYHDAVKRIVMVGRLAEQKNYSMMIKAMRIVHSQIPEIKLDIFGKGRFEEHLKKEIADNGLTNVVNLRGWTQKAIEEYSTSDLYVLSSDYEGMPNSLLEAMAVGIPCISTECQTGPRDMINNGVNGFLTAVNDPNEMAKQIIKVTEMDMNKRAEIGNRAKKEISNRFTQEIITDAWEQLIKELQRG